MCTHADNKLADDDSAVIVKEVNNGALVCRLCNFDVGKF